MSFVKHIPNAITSMNLFSGCVACIFALQHHYWAASICIICAALFDFCDGFAARMLKAYSDIGKELDSLADVVSFGVAPSMMLFALFSEWEMGWMVSGVDLFPYTAFLIAVFSGLRLAKFNVDTRQTNSFLGLPVPANALFWCALITDAPEYLRALSIGVLVLVMASSWILVSEVPMFSLKFKQFGWKENQLRYIFLILAASIILFTGLTGLSLTIILYVLLSVYDSRKSCVSNK